MFLKRRYVGHAAQMDLVNDLLKLQFGVQDMIYFLQFLMDLKIYGLLSLSECRIGLSSFLTFVFLFDSQTFRSGDARPRW